MRISIIAAIGQKRELGKQNALLWHIPEDLKHFRTVTTGHTVIMGRKTYESIGRPLPQRTNIVVTRQNVKVFPGCVTAHSLEGALEIANQMGETEVFIIGGGQLYSQAIYQAEMLYLTLVHTSDESADTYFPAYEDAFTVVSRRDGVSSEPPITFVILKKKD